MYVITIRWNRHFLVFELAVLVYIGSIICFAKKLSKMEVSKGQKYLAWHTLLVGSIVVCLSVLPAALVSRYAHNQEILQAVKKDQLCLAISIEKRQNGIYGELAGLDSAASDKGTIDSLRYHRGIYPVHWQAISHSTGFIKKAVTDSGFEKFYFEISDKISNGYYKEGFMPALKDIASDDSWEWTKPKGDKISFSYKMKPLSNELLEISSKIPHRFSFLNDPVDVTAVIFLECLLLVGLFLLIYRVSERIFLKKYVDYGNNLATKISLPFIEKYYDGRLDKSPYSDKPAEIDKLKLETKDAVIEYSPNWDKKLMNQWERDVIAKMQKYKDYYAVVLDNCLPVEKYLLYNFALNGFLNYKNVSEIYHLLDEVFLRSRTEKSECLA